MEIMNYSKVSIKKFLNFFLDLIVEREYFSILSFIFLFFIQERTKDGYSVFRRSSKNGRITILALDADRYRGDLKVLSSNINFQVLCIRHKWQGVLIRSLYGRRPPKAENVAKIGSVNKVQKFMTSFLVELYLIIKVDCVMTINYRYIEDFDWTLASEKIGVPYIMLYRECLLNVKRIRHDVKKRHRRMGVFHGTKIIVHNSICKSSFVDSGYCKSSKIKVCGALRMDSFLKKVNNYLSYSAIKEKKKFVLFYFPYNMSLFGKDSKCIDDDYKYKYAFNVWNGRENLFKDLHESILKLAKLNTDIDFIIKPKKVMMESKSWEFYEKVVSDSGVDVSSLDNYKIEPDLDVHKLIFESDIICALQSSTVIESGLAGKRVVFPLFNGYTETENFKDFGWKDDMMLFDVANNSSEFEEIVLDSFQNPAVSKTTLQKREKIFVKYFNDIDGNAYDCYVNEIKKTINC